MAIRRYTLPWPPSVNHIWRHVNGRTILSKKAREYFDAGKQDVWIQSGMMSIIPFTGPVKVELRLFPPDRRRRDIDNLTKLCLDLLVKSSIIKDDSQVSALHVLRECRHKNGSVFVTIEEVG